MNFELFNNESKSMIKSKTNMETKKYIILLFLILSMNCIYGQVTFTVNNFSKTFYGKIFISDTTEVFSKGWVGIFDKKSKKQLLKVSSEELTFNLHNGKVLANIKESPYGEQSQIIYEDFNFDGQKDFAIMDGQNSCYHGPSYQIYLHTVNGFKLNPDFTRLAQENCGMFDINRKERKIYTMTKSGCCWHQSKEYVVENNNPKTIKIIEDDQTNFPFSIYSEEIWNGKRMVKSIIKTINLEEEGIKPILTFHIDKNEKDIVLYNINDRTLNYAVINKDSTIQFPYPIETVYKNPDFIFDSKKNILSFKNKNATYKISNQTNKIEIEINVDGKIYIWIGNLQTKKGTLSDLLTTKLDNVVIN